MRKEIIKANNNEKEHISFDEMTDYVFADSLTADFIRESARINKHVMECPECYDMYQSLMVLHEEADRFASIETSGEKLLTRITKNK